MDRVALAVTVNSHSESQNRKPPTQIQLCLWFVDCIKDREYRLHADIKKRTKIERKLIRLAESKGFGLSRLGTSCVWLESAEANSYTGRCIFASRPSTLARDDIRSRSLGQSNRVSGGSGRLAVHQLVSQQGPRLGSIRLEGRHEGRTE
jgi:hypothetical protein